MGRVIKKEPKICLLCEFWKRNRFTQALGICNQDSESIKVTDYNHYCPVFRERENISDKERREHTEIIMDRE